MTDIWNKISDLAVKIEDRFRQYGETYDSSHCEYDWYNSLYRSEKYRRAHVEIVDNRDTYGIYILHSTIFPHHNDSSPIWGFDVICGKNKITGAFHDFSSSGNPNHSMMEWFKNQTKDLAWRKPRELPEWAKQIFSPNMIAAGNLQEDKEIQMLCDIALCSLDYYLEHVGITQESGADFHMAQNRYCYYQKQNPQVVKSMTAMGVPEDKILKFVDEVLFPEID